MAPGSQAISAGKFSRTDTDLISTDGTAFSSFLSYEGGTGTAALRTVLEKCVNGKPGDQFLMISPDAPEGTEAHTGKSYIFMYQVNADGTVDHYPIEFPGDNGQLERIAAQLGQTDAGNGVFTATPGISLQQVVETISAEVKNGPDSEKFGQYLKRLDSDLKTLEDARATEPITGAKSGREEITKSSEYKISRSEDGPKPLIHSEKFFEGGRIVAKSATVLHAVESSQAHSLIHMQPITPVPHQLKAELIGVPAHTPIFKENFQVMSVSETISEEERGRVNNDRLMTRETDPHIWYHQRQRELKEKELIQPRSKTGQDKSHKNLPSEKIADVILKRPEAKKREALRVRPRVVSVGLTPQLERRTPASVSPRAQLITVPAKFLPVNKKPRRLPSAVDMSLPEKTAASTMSYKALKREVASNHKAIILPGAPERKERKRNASQAGPLAVANSTARVETRKPGMKMARQARPDLRSSVGVKKSPPESLRNRLIRARLTLKRVVARLVNSPKKSPPAAFRLRRTRRFVQGGQDKVAGMRRNKLAAVAKKLSNLRVAIKNTLIKQTLTSFRRYPAISRGFRAVSRLRKKLALPGLSLTTRKAMTRIERRSPKPPAKKLRSVKVRAEGVKTSGPAGGSRAFRLIKRRASIIKVKRMVLKKTVRRLKSRKLRSRRAEEQLLIIQEELTLLNRRILEQKRKRKKKLAALRTNLKNPPREQPSA